MSKSIKQMVVCPGPSGNTYQVHVNYFGNGLKFLAEGPREGRSLDKVLADFLFDRKEKVMLTRWNSEDMVIAEVVPA